MQRAAPATRSKIIAPQQEARLLTARTLHAALATGYTLLLRQLLAATLVRVLEHGAMKAEEGSSFPRVDEAFENINKNNISTAIRPVPPDTVPNAVRLLEKVLGNVASSPQEAKFRSIKKANKQVAAKILPCRGALQLLAACGFRSADGVLTLPDDRLDIPTVQYALRRLGAMEGEKQAVAAAAAEAAEAARISY